MKTIGNIIWFIFGGMEIALEYFIAGLVLCITIIGIPFGIQVFKLGMMALWPFGAKVYPDIPSKGCLGVLMNIIWIPLAGLWIALTHVVFGLLFCITIVGIPFGLQHFKMAGLALTPFGHHVVTM